jgi:uncharacterized lipoprotein YddW (UPF0748 family)
MQLWTMLCLAGIGLSDRVESLDTFSYPSTQQARHTWEARADRGQGVPVETADESGRRVLTLTAPFATQPQAQRFYIDRRVEFDLSAAGEFQIEVFTTDPESAGRLSLYFRSGDGWYAASEACSGAGWRVVRFSKASFAVEGQPEGWHAIDTVRIAIWRGQPKDLVFRLRHLAAVQHAVALVIPTRSAGSEWQAALQAAQDVGEMLAALGLGSDAVEDESVPGGALGERRVAILAYNPRISTPAVDALVQFVERGGKLLVCYQLPPRLGDALGFGHPRYVRPETPGHLAEIRFHAGDIPHLPAAVRQASWNITTAEPVGHNARFIAQWYDERGTPTNLPAMLISDRGAFFSHIILRDDRAGKLRMLAGLLGHLEPSLWIAMADHSLQGAVRVGHCEDYDSLIRFVSASSVPDADEQLSAAQRLLDEARELRQAHDYPAVVRVATAIHEHLVRAYCRAQPSKTVEGRAFWNHSGTGAYPGDWERTAKELAAAGFNMVLPNMLWGGVAHYPSDVLPRSRTFEEHGDQIAQCLEAVRRHGLQVHVWKVNWNLSGAPRDFVARMRRETRCQVSVEGESQDWLCPSHPENLALEVESMLEVVGKYDVDGLHFDYIRYPGGDHCFCDGCRTRFEIQTGHAVDQWPADCHSGALREPYTRWRCDQITRLVRAVHQRAKALRPDLAISAAVFSEYPGCRESVAQDWPLWVADGYLDFICPMNYTQSDPGFAGLLSNQMRLVAGRIPIYPGIGQWRLDDHRTVGQIHLARRLGADGFTIFDLTGDSIQSAARAVGLGIGRLPAEPPHGKSRQ